jgi:hypothetical protein
MAGNWSIILLLLVIFLHGSRGQVQKCRDEGNETHIEIRDCDSISYGNLSRDFEMEKIVRFSGSSRNNSFSRIDAKMFQQMTRLVEIWLYNCEVENVDENAFSNLRVLKQLHLSHNKIKNLHENTFRSLVDLKVLYLSYNQLKVIPPKLFETNRKLKELSIGWNKIKDIPVDLFAKLADLEKLVISKIDIEVIHGGTFKENKKLRKLWLHENKIGAISEGTFDGLTQLIHLDLDYNQCIEKDYNSPIDFDQVSRDLTDCFNNYKNIFCATTTKSDLPLILTAISTILSVAGMTIIKFIRKAQKLLKMQGRENFHYYSKPDTPEQIEHVQWEELRRESRALKPDKTR